MKRLKIWKVLIFILFWLEADSKIVKPINTYLPTTNFQSSFPYITGDTIRESCDHILDTVQDFDHTKVQAGDTIFVMINFLEYFFEEYHPRIQNPYIIVTAHFFDESDDGVPGKFVRYLHEDKLAGWFTHNADTVLHPKLHHLPIGIANAYYSSGDKAAFDESIQLYGNNKNRTKLLYMNFSFRSSCIKCAAERQAAYNEFSNKPWCTAVFQTNPEDAVLRQSMRSYLREMAQHKFVVSPRGNGLDCFRTWEALLMGCYPIVISSSLNPLFKDLPVVIVNSWSEVTQEFLEQKYQEMINSTYNLEKIYMPYWLQEIEKLKTLIKSKS